MINFPLFGYAFKFEYFTILYTKNKRLSFTGLGFAWILPGNRCVKTKDFPCWGFGDAQCWTQTITFIMKVLWLKSMDWSSVQHIQFCITHQLLHFFLSLNISYYFWVKVLFRKCWCLYLVRNSFWANLSWIQKLECKNEQYHDKYHFKKRR